MHDASLVGPGVALFLDSVRGGERGLGSLRALLRASVPPQRLTAPVTQIESPPRGLTSTYHPLGVKASTHEF